MKIQKKKYFFLEGGGGEGSEGGGGKGGRVRLGGQVGCERRIEVEKRIFCENAKKKNFFFGGGGGGGSVGGGGVGGRGRVGGVRVDVNAMLGVGVMWGMGDVNQE